MTIPFVDFRPMHNEVSIELDSVWKRIRSSEYYILGEELKQFEAEFAAYCGRKYAIGCGNGLDAIYLSLKALGIGYGDEVIVPAHTFAATVLAVTYTGATPVLVDIESISYNIDPVKIKNAITKRTKAIIPVHLYGQAAKMEEIEKIANEYKLYILEDAAQAHGATQSGKKIGSWSIAACFSFYPGKNLGAMGDAGAIITDNSQIADKLISLRNYGSKIMYRHDERGTNSRLDELQAAVLNVKLPHLDTWNKDRRATADKYLNGITTHKIVLPQIPTGNTHVFHIFAIRCKQRDKLQRYLADNGVQTKIHYPIPVHLQKAFSDLGHRNGSFPIAEEVANTQLSLPIYYGMTEEQVVHVINILNRF